MADIVLRSVVKFCVRLKLSPQEILKQIKISDFHQHAEKHLFTNGMGGFRMEEPPCQLTTDRIDRHSQ